MVSHGKANLALCGFDKDLVTFVSGVLCGVKNNQDLILFKQLRFILAHMKRSIVYERALSAVVQLEKETCATLSVSSHQFIEAVYRSFEQFAREDSFCMICRAQNAGAMPLVHGEAAGVLCPSGERDALRSLLALSKVEVVRSNDGSFVSGKYRTYMVIPVSGKKDVFFCIVIARTKGHFKDVEIQAARLMQISYCQAFRSIRSRNKKVSALAEDTRHHMLLATQAIASREKEKGDQIARTMDWSAGIGSDFARSWQTADGGALLVVADVTASDAERLTALIYLDTWFSLYSRSTIDAVKILERLNADVIARSSEWYISAVIIQWDARKKIINASVCGNAFLVFFAHEEMESSIISCDQAAGVSRDFTAKSVSQAVTSGDIVCACTDGLSCTLKRNGDLFGMEEIGEIVKKHYYLSAKDLGSKILSSVEEKEEKTNNRDDRTIHILKIE